MFESNDVLSASVTISDSLTAISTSLDDLASSVTAMAWSESGRITVPYTEATSAAASAVDGLHYYYDGVAHTITVGTPDYTYASTAADTVTVQFDELHDRYVRASEDIEWRPHYMGKPFFRDEENFDPAEENDLVDLLS